MSQKSLLVAALAALLGAVALPQTTCAQGDPPQFDEGVNEEAPEEDETSFDISAGAVINTGNTSSWAANLGTKFSIIRGRHGFAAEWAFNYGQTNIPGDDPDEGFIDTARNSNARARYDFYITPMDALFLSVVHRWDTFAGLDTRLQLQGGYLRNFYRADKHRFWGEVGYDFTYDNFDPDPLLDDMGMELDGEAFVHAGRVYLGYNNELNEHVRLFLGAEVLLNLQEIEDVRFNLDAALRSTIVGSLQVELKFKLLFDNVPVEGRTPVDTTTTVNLVYSFI